MSQKPPFYVTTAIYYANAAPHIGHAYEVIVADTIARFARMQGKNVFFLTGMDEHGIKVEKTATRHGMEPKAYVDQIAKQFEQTWRFLNIQYSRFIRTTDPDHHRTVGMIWRQLLSQGDIYKASYTGLYCSGCETFCLPRDLTPDGLCPNHLMPPDPVTEENYFFRLSKYKQAIIDHLERHPDFIIPAFRQAEVLNQLEEIEDISVSRVKKSVSWGIPVPDDPEQVIYVWIDALSNYLTGIDWAKDTPHAEIFWPAEVHVIGKDILRFHAIYWPAMLLALGIELPKRLLVHGFITVADTKISKSTGNAIGVEDLARRFELANPDPIRYYMLTAAPMGQDGSYTDDAFKLKINADLANNLGNLLNRTLNMLMKYCNGVAPEPDSTYTPLLSADLLNKVTSAYTQFAFGEATEHIMTLVDAANKVINDQEPWTLHKNGAFDQLNTLLYTILEALRQTALMLSPIVPTLAQNMRQQLGFAGSLELCRWADITEKPLPSGQVICLGEPLLLRLESDIVGASKKR